MNKYISTVMHTSPEKVDQVSAYKESLIFVLALFQLGFTGIVFIICLLFSHKIAGPMYKIQKYLRGIREGESHGTLYFRKGDYFTEVADDFNETFENIQEGYKQDMVYLSEISSYLSNLSLVVPDDKKVVLSEINNKLTEIQERYNNIY